MTCCSFWASACFCASVFSGVSGLSSPSPRRHFDLQSLQPHFSDAPWFAHEVAQRPSDFEGLDGDEGRHVGTALLTDDDARTTDRHAWKRAAFELFNGDFTLELFAEQRNDLRFESLGTDGNRQGGKDDHYRENA